MATTTRTETTEEQAVRQFEQQTRGLVERAETLEIMTPTEYEIAATDLQTIKQRAKEMDALRRSLTRPLDEAKRGIMALFKPVEVELGQAERLYKGALLDYQTEQERIRAAEEARLRAEARKKEERLQARAEAAAAKGQVEKAAMLEEQAESVPVPIVAAPTPAVSGISTRQTWHAEVMDKVLLIEAVAQGLVPDVVLEPVMSVLNAQARALKGALNYPGVKAVSDSVVAAGQSRDPVPPQRRR